jgi:hypothetical protein
MASVARRRAAANLLTIGPIDHLWPRRAYVLPALTDYATARAELLALAEEAGATSLEAHRHPLLGPEAVELFTDVARFGAAPDEAQTVVVVASGTHGVEGHAGWGLQRLLLEGGRLGALPPGIAVVLIHAINPYGMAWSRRVDHENIDVNRNFVDFGVALPDNRGYRDIADILNPETLDLDDTSWQDQLWAFAADVGVTEAFRAITGGQYELPSGMQFGGQRVSWSARTLRAIWRDHLASARTVFNLDIHTGLGPCAGLTLFQTADADDVSAEVGARWFPKVLRADRPGTADPLSIGVLGPGLEAALAPTQLVVPIVVEFGTLDDAVVLASMRADNWLHQHGDPTSELGAEVRARTRQAFFVDDASWRAAVADQGLDTIHVALDAAAESPAA